MTHQIMCPLSRIGIAEKDPVACYILIPQKSHLELGTVESHYSPIKIPIYGEYAGDSKLQQTEFHEEYDILMDVTRRSLAEKKEIIDVSCDMKTGSYEPVSSLIHLIDRICNYDIKLKATGTSLRYVMFHKNVHDELLETAGSEVNTLLNERYDIIIQEEIKSADYGHGRPSFLTIDENPYLMDVGELMIKGRLFDHVIRTIHHVWQPNVMMIGTHTGNKNMLATLMNSGKKLLRKKEAHMNKNESRVNV